MASCVEPSPAEVPMQATRLSDVQASYDQDWPLVFKCDQGTGYGYIQITCGHSNGWTGPTRECGGTFGEIMLSNISVAFH